MSDDGLDQKNVLLALTPKASSVQVCFIENTIERIATLVAQTDASDADQVAYAVRCSQGYWEGVEKAVTSLYKALPESLAEGGYEPDEKPAKKCATVVKVGLVEAEQLVGELLSATQPVTALFYSDAYKPVDQTPNLYVDFLWGWFGFLNVWTQIMPLIQIPPGSETGKPGGP